MADVYKVRVQVYDETTGQLLGDADVQTTADLVYFSDGETFQQKLTVGKLTGPAGKDGATGATGAKGSDGQRGSQWYNGTGITGTNTTDTVFSGSGVTTALVGDYYQNTGTGADRGRMYRCTIAGNASTAKWVYAGSILGATGGTGLAGKDGKDGDSIKVGTSYETGESRKLFFKLLS
ncbi:hypothetical protein SAMN05443270_3787 [Lacrimispora sphenoides]|uniref:hypothetical protein n=1 Tax=Lacrimispora sphenoides TaxID=29370 RepID=UPI0008C8A4EB|nr:hypothetical protein [Lacrimispora sphenoides]SEU24404.1 hypothetical protein SAMN05443270_3787 [Lacrimispora sphenoides]